MPNPALAGNANRWALALKTMIRMNKIKNMASKYSVDITAYEYDVLNKNYLISMTCKSYLQSVIKHDDEVALILTLKELQGLIGYIAAEANHARSKRNREDLDGMCDYLEAVEEDIKNGRIESFDATLTRL
jgi:hypothetical protein